MVTTQTLTVMHWDRARLPLPQDVPEPIHDGDTLWLELDRGFRDHSIIDVRLYRVFAPELTQTGGPDTREFVRGWLLAHSDGAGTWPLSVDTLRVRDNTHEQTTLERYLAVVYNANRSANLNVDVQAYVDAQGFPGGRGS